MNPFLFASSAFIFSVVRGYLVAPPGAVAPGTTSQCSEWVGYNSLWACENIEVLFGITEAEFEDWNPIVTKMGEGCTLSPGFYYCVQINFKSNTGTTTSSSSPSLTPSSTITTPTTTGNGVSTPTPHQTGMASNCDKFYLVGSGDECGTIATNEGISLADFYSWNPAVGSSCQYLDLGDYVCVGVETCTSSSCSTITTTTPTHTTTTTGNGISTPTPHQTGMASNCDKFYLVASGDECGTIASYEGISLADFYSWNPAVGSSCQYLDLGDYVCVGVETCTSSSCFTITTTTPTHTTTTTGNGISTPTPHQTGMASNCDKFYLVASGDECGTIASYEDISLTEFYSWNPAVGTNCQYLDLGDYVCVGVEKNT